MYADMEDSDDDENHDANDIWEKEKMTGVAASLRKKRGDNGAFLKKDFCKKYIAYCKNKIKPTLTDEVQLFFGFFIIQEYSKCCLTTVNSRSGTPKTSTDFLIGTEN
jgi:hypothetical protein